MRASTPILCGLLVIALMASATSQESESDPLDRPVEISAAGATAGEVIEAVVDQTGLDLIADRDAMELGAVDIQVTATPARVVLEGLTLVVHGLQIHLGSPGVILVRREPAGAPAPSAPVLLELSGEGGSMPSRPAPPAPPPALHDGDVPNAPEPRDPDAPAASEDDLDLEPISLGLLYYRAGLRHLEAGAIELARSCFRRALKEEPDAEFRHDARVVSTMLGEQEER